MKIALVSFWKLSPDGSRLISALLKREGHTVKSIFLIRRAVFNYTDEELKQMHEILKEVDLVLLAVYSQFAFRAIHITEFIRENYPLMKVFWGGPHCISAPELSLPYADGICFSEGDIVVPELVRKIENGVDYTSTPNMAFNINGKHKVNEVLPIFTDLDNLPYPDFDWEDQYIMEDHLSQMTRESMYENLTRYPFNKPIYWCLTARGCPNNCSYCNNCRYTAMHGNNKMRFRSVDHFLGELQLALKQFSSCQIIGFSDDDFLMRPRKQIEEFAEKYTKQIGLPFVIAISANTYNEEKMGILIKSGLYAVQMGVQSGSQRVLDEVFNRKIPVSKTKVALKKLENLNKTHGIKVLLDFIIDNPYETKPDILQTYHYLVDVSKHTRLNIFVLSFFPGTPIYKQAISDGLIKAFSKETFRSYVNRNIRYQINYPTFLILLLQLLHSSGFRKFIPNSLLHAFGSNCASKIASILPRSFYAFLMRVVQFISRKVIKNNRSKRRSGSISPSH